MEPARSQVLIIGAGFGGLACAQALGDAPGLVTVVDRRNYHLFVPLLYQVATAALSPADIAFPIRRALSRHGNVEVVLGEVTGVDLNSRRVLLADGGQLAFERLVVATGSRYAYFGHDDWPAFAPGLKGIPDARAIRARILTAFEEAERCSDPERQKALMTTVVIGGGPTGVEMAGAVAELTREALAADFRHIRTRTAPTYLVEAGPRLLAAFPEDLATYARAALERLGVTVITGAPVEDVTATGVRIGGSPIEAATIVWGAGVQASPAAAWLGVAPDRMGHIEVAPDLSVPGLKNVYVLGDTALLKADGAPLPGLAQVAKQQGEHLGKGLARELRSGDPPMPFRFRNRGSTAVIGRHAAVFDFGRHRMKGRLAWLLWAIVHVYLLVGFENRLLVSLQWLFRYVSRQRNARLID